MVALSAAVYAGPKIDPVMDAIVAAQKSWSAKKPTETVRELERALASARAAAPLEVRRVVAVRRPSKGLGMYEPLPKGEIEFRTLWLYVEVANFGLRPSGALHEIALSVEGEFFDGEGVSIGSRGLGEHKFETRSTEGVTSFGLDVRLGDTAPKGAYELKLTVKDVPSGETASERLRFVIP